MLSVSNSIEILIFFVMLYINFMRKFYFFLLFGLLFPLYFLFPSLSPFLLLSSPSTFSFCYFSSLSINCYLKSLFFIKCEFSKHIFYVILTSIFFLWGYVHAWDRNIWYRCWHVSKTKQKIRFEIILLSPHLLYVTEKGL